MNEVEDQWRLASGPFTRTLAELEDDDNSTVILSVKLVREMCRLIGYQTIGRR